MVSLLSFNLLDNFNYLFTILLYYSLSYLSSILSHFVTNLVGFIGRNRDTFLMVEPNKDTFSISSAALQAACLLRSNFHQGAIFIKGNAHSSNPSSPVLRAPPPHRCCRRKRSLCWVVAAAVLGCNRTLNPRMKCKRILAAASIVICGSPAAAASKWRWTSTSDRDCNRDDGWTRRKTAINENVFSKFYLTVSVAVMKTFS